MLVLGRRGVLAMYARQGYVSGAEVFGSYVMIIAASVALALVGLLLGAIALRRLPPPRPAGRKWGLTAFLLIPVAWYVWWGNIYVWLLSKP